MTHPCQAPRPTITSHMTRPPSAPSPWGPSITSNTQAAGASPAPSIAPGSVRVVLIDGPTTDPASAAWTTKVKAALATDGTIVHEEAVTALTADEGQRIITAAITAVGAAGFDAVITSSDAVAGGVISGLTAAKVDPATKLVTGGDATIPGVQQVLLGSQLLTTYAPPSDEAQLAAVVACGLATGEGLPAGLVTTPVSNGTADIPSLLLTAIVVTSDGSIAGTRSVADTIVADTAFGPDTATLICTTDVLAACQANSISLPSASPSPGPSASPGASPSASTTPVPAPGRPRRAESGTQRRAGPAPSQAPSSAPSPAASAAP